MAAAVLAGCLVATARPSAQTAADAFERGVVALHNFEYEDANEAFAAARALDPGFALAYWGEAMTYHQSLWRNEDVAAGRRVLSQLAGNAAARRSAVATAKGRGLIDAVALLFGDADSATRRTRYAEAMGELHQAYPDDPDIAAFYALALLGTMSRSLIGYVDTHEGHSASLAGSETQARVAGILTRVLAAHPSHPGALHYLLHAYDDPEHAPLALEAARRYATVAARSSHALHMPAHIFLQLGMWDEAAASDREAYAASDEWVRAKGLPLTMRSYHALSWLQYELLQLGRYREARDTTAQLEPTARASGEATLTSDLASMRARYVVESRDWRVLAGVRDFANVHELYAIGASAARTGDLPLARLAAGELATRSTQEQEGDLRPAVAIMERQVAGLILLAEGRGSEAIAILQAAALAEDRLPPPLGLPAPIKPAAELLGEVLLDAGRADEAIEAFERSLGRYANRTLSVLGLARASVRAGRVEAAREHYRAVLGNYAAADADRPEVAEARAALDGAGAAAPGRWPMAAGGAAVAALVWWAIRRAAGSPRRTPV